MQRDIVPFCFSLVNIKRFELGSNILQMLLGFRVFLYHLSPNSECAISTEQINSLVVIKMKERVILIVFYYCLPKFKASLWSKHLIKKKNLRFSHSLFIKIHRRAINCIKNDSSRIISDCMLIYTCACVRLRDVQVFAHARIFCVYTV